MYVEETQISGYIRGCLIQFIFGVVYICWECARLSRPESLEESKIFSYAVLFDIH